MAELDFALLAEFARVDPAGLLTVVGGGFDRVNASGPGLVQQVFVAFRTRLDEGERTVSFKIRVVSPGEDQAEVAVSGVTAANPPAEPLPEHLGVVNVVGLGIPINAEGRYVVQVSIGGSLARELSFVVNFAPTTAS